MARYRKTFVAVVGVLAQVIASGALPAEWLPWANVALALATALSVWRVPNETAPPGRHELGADVPPEGVAP